jgi:hypothetical protein
MIVFGSKTEEEVGRVGGRLGRSQEGVGEGCCECGRGWREVRAGGGGVRRKGGRGELFGVGKEWGEVGGGLVRGNWLGEIEVL